jgi:Flp pilus assembly protein TadD
MTTNLNANDAYINGMFSLLKENLKDSIKHFTRAIELDPDHSLAFMSRGSAFFRRGRLEDALADFDRTIELKPDQARPYHLRGLTKERRGNDDGAIADFEKAIELNPEYGAAHYSLANLHAKMGNEDLAVENIKMVEFLTNKNAEEFANDANVWRSQHLRLESESAGEIGR